MRRMEENWSLFDDDSEEDVLESLELVKGKPEEVDADTEVGLDVRPVVDSCEEVVLLDWRRLVAVDDTAAIDVEVERIDFEVEIAAVLEGSREGFTPAVS